MYIGNQPYQVAFVTDTFNGNGSTVAFTMSVAPANTASVLVAVSGVLQDPSTYSVSGTTLTFTAAPPSGTGNISARYLGIPASGVTTTAYRTVTEFTATASQTTFTPPSYTVGFINVYRNGVLLGSADYTATNGTTVVLTSAANSGDLVTVESFLVSSVLNAIPATAGSVGSTYIAAGAVGNSQLASAAVSQSNIGTNVAGTGPAFSAYASTTTSCASSVATKVNLASENFDTANCFASSRFTPNVAGYYQLNFAVRMEGVNAYQPILYVNGAASVAGSNPIANSYCNTGSALVYLNGTTDYAELYNYNGNASTQTVSANSTQTVFSGFLARAA